MKNKFEYFNLSFVILIFVIGIGVLPAEANLIFDAAGLTNNGSLSLNSSATSNITIGNNLTTGKVVLGGALDMGTKDITSTGSIGTTGSRLTKGWFTDFEVTNPIVGSITGSAATLTNARNIAGVSFDGSADISIASTDLSDTTNITRLDATNSFSLINPLTTLAESWIGPSSTAGIYFKDGNVGFGTTSPTNLFSLGGTADRTIWMERNTIADTTGNNLTLQAGGATVLSTNKTGGALHLHAGLSTGNAQPADINLATTVMGTSSGTADQALIHKFMIHNKVYSMPDNVNTQIYSINLPTANTGAIVHMSFTYTVTDGVNAGSHGGIFVCAFINNAGTVSGSCTDSGEATAGVGAGAGIDAQIITVVGTVATLEVKFNNTFGTNPIGKLTVQILNNSATNFTWL
ncbi:MAG: hypothetical protein WC694_01615 [Candidatus Paceibacterota bacterium]|jgi:hypothetical protein